METVDTILDISLEKKALRDFKMYVEKFEAFGKYVSFGSLTCRLLIVVIFKVDKLHLSHLCIFEKVDFAKIA